MKRPPTLQDLADKLGLSVATISLALRGQGNLSDETRKRVRDAARKIGYRPNTYAAALSARQHPARQHDIPLAILRRKPRLNAAWYPVDSFVEGIRKRGSELGYRVEIFAHESGSSLGALLRVMFNRGFKGLFLAPVGDFAPPLPEWGNFSVLSCGRFDTTSPFHTIRHEIFESTLDVLTRLRDKGCKRIGLSLFKHDPPIIDDKQRVAAALIARTAIGCKVIPYFYQTAEDIVSFVRKERFDGVASFSSADYFHLSAAGFKIPEDLQFAALHLYDEQWNKQVNGLLPSEYSCGVAAANRMDAMVRHHECGIPEVPEHVVVLPRWRDAMAEIPH